MIKGDKMAKNNKGFSNVIDLDLASELASIEAGLNAAKRAHSYGELKAYTRYIATCTGRILKKIEDKEEYA